MVETLINQVVYILRTVAQTHVFLGSQTTLQLGNGSVATDETGKTRTCAVPGHLDQEKDLLLLGMEG